MAACGSKFQTSKTHRIDEKPCNFEPRSLVTEIIVKTSSNDWYGELQPLTFRGATAPQFQGATEHGRMAGVGVCRRRKVPRHLFLKAASICLTQENPKQSRCEKLKLFQIGSRLEPPANQTGSAASIPLVWGCMTPQETYHHVILGFSHSQVKGQNEGTPSLYKYEQYDIL